MALTRWILALCGYARLEVCGVHPERVLNACAAADIACTASEPVDAYTLRITVRARCADTVTELARRSQCEVKTLYCRGLPQLLRRAARYRGACAGLLVAVLAVLTSSLFIWRIDVTGNETLTTGQILRCLDECGVRPGTYWPALSNDLVLMGMGLWFCFKRRKMPALPCLAGLEILLSMVLFTQVQTTGSQHMLLFLPGWFLLFLIGAAALAEGMNRRRNLKIGFWLFTIAFATSVRCSPLTTVALPDFLIGRTLLSASPQESARDFAAIDDLVYDRKDLPQIKAIASWIDTHCADGEIAYMIPHDTLYCPDHFKNCLLPQTPINGKLAFGFSVPGTHYFPMQFFEAKYVLTADPFPLTHVNDPENEMSHKLNDRFLAVRDEYFALEETFDMGNGTTFTIWRRTVAPTRAEVEYYLSAFTEEDAKYPEMFSQVAENWLAARGL